MTTTARERRRRGRPPLWSLAAALLAAGSLVAAGGQLRTAGATPLPVWPWTATITSSRVAGLHVGEEVDLIHLDNITMEDIGGDVVGQASLHVVAGRNPGASPGRVSLIGCGATISGPVVATSVLSWAPTRLVAGLQGQVTVTLGHRYDLLLLTGSAAAASILATVPRIVPLVPSPVSPRTTS